MYLYRLSRSETEDSPLKKQKYTTLPQETRGVTDNDTRMVSVFSSCNEGETATDISLIGRSGDIFRSRGFGTLPCLISFASHTRNRRTYLESQSYVFSPPSYVLEPEESAVQRRKKTSVRVRASESLRTKPEIVIAIASFQVLSLSSFSQCLKAWSSYNYEYLRLIQPCISQLSV